MWKQNGDYQSFIVDFDVYYYRMPDFLVQSWNWYTLRILMFLFW